MGVVFMNLGQRIGYLERNIIWVGKKSEAFVMVADSPMQESVDLNYAACSI